MEQPNSIPNNLLSQIIDETPPKPNYRAIGFDNFAVVIPVRILQATVHYRPLSVWVTISDQLYRGAGGGRASGAGTPRGVRGFKPAGNMLLGLLQNMQTLDYRSRSSTYPHSIDILARIYRIFTENPPKSYVYPMQFPKQKQQENKGKYRKFRFCGVTPNLRRFCREPVRPRKPCFSSFQHVPKRLTVHFFEFRSENFSRSTNVCPKSSKSGLGIRILYVISIMENALGNKGKQ